ncbi:MAG TPA: flagellin [Candidatus Acidoferrales bacterium]|nr:flagellin [Candidatus Acidoferrales bacterium]
MNVLIGADNVLLNLDRNQRAFEQTVTQLSSGLRINNAADDPSGNAIATNLTSKASGLQQAVNNVQNGVNALNVAQGALKSVQDILIRINNLLVEANSDINSSSDLENIQAEINSLLTEINTIGEKTNFNGLNLLNGQFDTSEGSPASFVEVQSPYGGTTQVTNETGAAGGGPGPLVSNAGTPEVGGTFVPALMVFTVTGYSPNTIDPDSGTDYGPGVYVQFDAYSTAGPSVFGEEPLYQDISGIGVNSGQYVDVPYLSPNGENLLLNFTLANLTEADVGASIAFLSTAAVGPSNGRALTINDGGDEGQILSISLPTVSTNALNLSDISVLLPQLVTTPEGDGGPEATPGLASSNVMVASYAQILVQNALTTITTNEADIGAQIISMTDDETIDNTTDVNLDASASNITDLNVGQATTQYTQEQILTSVGTEVLSQIQSNGKILTALLIQALIA